MIPTKDQLKDLRTFTPNEMVFPAHFWKFDEKTKEYDSVVFFKEWIDKMNEEEKKEVREWLKTNCDSGLLFTRINAPFKRFSE